MQQTFSYDRSTSAVRQVAAEPAVRQAADEPDPEFDVDLNELQVAAYLVFILSLETYMGWLQETGRPEDDVLQKGLALAKMAERQNLEAIGNFIRSSLTSKASIALLDAALRSPPSAKGLAMRAMKLRTVLSKGGTATAKAVFGTSTKARGLVMAAIDASMIDDPDTALNKFAALKLDKNKKLEAWIDAASAACVTPGTAPISPVQEATRGASDAAAELFKTQVQQEAKPGTSEAVTSRDEQVAALTKVQSEATAAAKKAMDQAGEVDRPLTKAEVIGVATATATAVVSAPDKPQNIPPALQRLDPEQRAAAMTGGKVRVSAGAGSGKSTTLLARVQYLIDGGATPNRMIVMSFNKKAADELAVKMAGKIGSDRVSTTKNPQPGGARVGTMHSLFLKAINEYGTPEQKAMFAKVNGRGGIVKAEKIFSAVKEIWDECFRDIDKDPPGDPEGRERELSDDELWKMPPKSKRMMAYLNLFQGQGWSLQQAAEWTETQGGEPEAFQALKFFETYEGLKGTLGKNWRPDLCGQRPSPAFDKFVKNNRADKPRAGDFNDMLAVFHNILKTQPLARKKIQGYLDHVMVDECQDLNPLQFEILQMMTEHIQTDDPKKSFWMVGDDKQSIYQFRGADPNNFIALDQMGFKDRQITTNYRCAPEFVDAANTLIANNKNQIPMEAKAAPNRARGEASLIVKKTDDDVQAAREFGKKIRAAVAAGEPLANFAVLARTNAELAIYQQMCATLGLRYVQKKAASVFASQESETFRAFASSVAGSPATVQDQFCQTLMSAGVFKPKLDVDKGENQKKAHAAMKGVLREYCSRNRKDLNTFDPIAEARNNPAFLPFVYSKFGAPEYGARKDAAKAGPLLEGIMQLREFMKEPGFTSKDLFQGVLALPVVDLVPPDQSSTGGWEEVVRTFGESTEKRMAFRAAQEDADEDPELADERPSLGTLDFVYDMLQPSDVDPDYNPQDPKAFFERFEGLAAKGAELRIDPDVWDKKQEDEGIPLAQRTAPPGVYLGTVHSTKGAEWEDVTLLMPKGKFPMERVPPKPRPNVVPENDFVDAETKMESERRLGYVGLTRAKKTMTVLCPGGFSPFVGEAGLKAGQNVPQPATSIPGEVLATPLDVLAAEGGEETLEGDFDDSDLTEVFDPDAAIDTIMKQAGLFVSRSRKGHESSVYSYERSVK